MEVGRQRHAPAALPPGRTRYPLRLGGLQSRSEQVRKISPPSGFDPRTFQVVASRYTDRAILALLKTVTSKIETFASVALKIGKNGCQNSSV